MVLFYFKLDSSSVLLPSKVEANSMKFHFVKAQIANGAPKKYHYRNFYLERFLTKGELLQTKRFNRASASAKTAKKPAALIRGTQRGYSSKPLKHSIVERILVFKR